MLSRSGGLIRSITFAGFAGGKGGKERKCKRSIFVNGYSDQAASREASNVNISNILLHFYRNTATRSIDKILT